MKKKLNFIKKIENNKKLYGIFIKNSILNHIDQTTFITNSDQLFQLGFIHKNNEKIPAHFHPKRKRVINKTSEFLILKKGKAKITFLSNQNKIIQSINMQINDMLLIYDGAHEITCSKESIFLEIKQGPYNIKKDKKIL